MKRIWDSYKNVSALTKTEFLELRFAVCARDGVKYVRIAEWYKRRSDGVWKPSRDGLSIPVEVPIKEGTEIISVFPEVLKHLQALMPEIEKLPIDDDDTAVYIEVKPRAPRKKV